MVDPSVLVNDSFAAREFAKLCGSNIVLDTGVVWVFDNTTNSVSSIITVGAQPSTISIDRTRRKAIVVNYSSNTVNIIDLASDSVIATINGNPAYRTANAVLDNINNKIFIQDGLDLVVRDYTTTSILTTVYGDFYPNRSMEINTHSNKLYLANFYSNILNQFLSS
jgi:YVTN family beta-propeller protein